jgi:hypothetical protein
MLPVYARPASRSIVLRPARTWPKVQYRTVSIPVHGDLVHVDGESLAFALRGRVLCRPCIAEHLGATVENVRQVCQALLLPEKAARCDGCLAQTAVHWYR